MTATFVPVRLPPERLVEAAAVMGRAAVDDPIFAYALPDAAQRAAGVPRMLETVLRIGLKHGEVWVTPPPIAGVACWISPAHPTVTAADRDAAGWREVGAAWGAEAFARYQAFAADVAGVLGPLAAEPHWYLAWLCVEPDQHGRGIGSALVRHVTARADAERISCQLFTSAPRNVPTYERLGFRVRHETALPRSGVRIWVMARRPGADDADGGWRTTPPLAPAQPVVDDAGHERPPGHRHDPPGRRQDRGGRPPGRRARGADGRGSGRPPRGHAGRRPSPPAPRHPGRREDGRWGVAGLAAGTRGGRTARTSARRAPGRRQDTARTPPPKSPLRTPRLRPCSMASGRRSPTCGSSSPSAAGSWRPSGSGWTSCTGRP